MSQEIKRRWKASIFLGTMSGLLWILISGLITDYLLITSVTELDRKLLLGDIPIMLKIGFLLFSSLSCFGTLPMILIVTLGSFFQFSITGDSEIDRYWKNPKIKG